MLIKYYYKMSDVDKDGPFKHSNGVLCCGWSNLQLFSMIVGRKGEAKVKRV